MRINRVTLQKKSRLAGFFLFLLAACQPDPKPMVPGLLSYQQAEVALQQQMPVKAAQLFRLSAEQGYLPAIDAYLKAQKVAGIKPDTLAALAWVAQLPWAAESVPIKTDSATESISLQSVLAELGAWQQLTVEQQHQYQQPFTKLKLQHKQCALRLQPVVTTLHTARQWAMLLQQWQQDRQLSALQLCFNPPQFIDSQQLACTEQVGRRIRCQADALVPVVLQGKATQLVVLAGMGRASYNNGWLQLPVDASLALLRHEISHLFGFLDEYPLPAEVASEECVTGRITPNLLFSKHDLPAYLKYWQLSAHQIQLTPVHTCQHQGRLAYRVVAADSHLLHYELAMPALYLKLMQQQLKQPQLLMPVQYYFAFLARQQQDWQQWQQFMQLAAGSGYPPAIAALTEVAAADKGTVATHATLE